ncbi:BamA/TamA family outer membrane protein [Parabacteroides sp. OttesenSCG-928-G21]|nr:BamA/TamA family outer membrane protein [Parabacteroides sp. OttesenSCG-928-G21]
MSNYLKHIKIIQAGTLIRLISVLLLVLSGCSTTKNLPEGETLYTGIKKLEIVDPDRSKEGDAALQEVEGALSYPPNNSLFGSSTTRIPFPVGLWIYNGFQKYNKGIGKWIFDKFAAKPVLISTVNPDVRTSVANNMLREYGYFDGHVSHEVIPDTKDSLKAKVSYTVEMNHAYTYDSIQYMRMRHYADTIIQANDKDRLLHKDDQFNVIKLENERQRISTLLRNNGFYYYRPEYIVYEADTLATPGKIWLRVMRKSGTPNNALQPYKIGNISVYMNGYNGEAPTDSVQYKDMTIYYEGKLRIRPPVLYGRLRFKPGDLYTQEEQQRSQTGLSRLSVFRYAEFQYIPQESVLDSVQRGRYNMRDSSEHYLNVRINTTYDLPYDGEFEINAKTKDNNYAGPGAIFSLTRRNAFRGGEILGFQLRGSYEWQTGNQTEGASKVNSYELGANATLTVPFILFPGYIYRDLVQPSSTTFKVSVDWMNRAHYFKMTSLGFSMAYDFRPTPTTRHTITPFRLNYNKLNPTDQFLERAEENRSLLLSLQDQFIPAMSYAFTYDNTSVSDRHFFSWSSSITQAGNIIGGIYSLAGKDFNEANKNLLGSPFAQFIKGTSEIKYNYRIDKNNRLVFRMMGGAIYSYGNARISPYSEQFYIGGANSVRAFTIRSVGPGRYQSPLNADGTVNKYAYIDRTGDIKFEANLEYRFRIAGDLNGALFLDSGGIWLIRDDKDRPGGTLKKGNFFKDLATGTGVGIRYALSFMVLRLDLGIALHMPYDTGKSGYFNAPKLFKNGSYSWHLAVGYPF